MGSTFSKQQITVLPSTNCCILKCSYILVPSFSFFNPVLFSLILYSKGGEALTHASQTRCGCPTPGDI